MKEITYKSLEDYLKVVESYVDPKIVKIYEIGGMKSDRRAWLTAVTFMRTWLFKWEGTYSDEAIDRLRHVEHREASIREVMPAGKYFG